MNTYHDCQCALLNVESTIVWWFWWLWWFWYWWLLWIYNPTKCHFGRRGSCKGDAQHSCCLRQPLTKFILINYWSESLWGCQILIFWKKECKGWGGSYSATRSAHIWSHKSCSEIPLFLRYSGKPAMSSSGQASSRQASVTSRSLDKVIIWYWFR